jgi:hypothetical protein
LASSLGVTQILEVMMKPLSITTLSPLGSVSHPVSEGKLNANYVCARIRTHVHSDYINEHHHTVLE